MNLLLKKIKDCQICEKHLPLPPRPVLSFSKEAKILIVGQAPGIKAHESETPWNDASGERLRDWLGVTKETFYNSQKIAIAPMGFCYPGRGKTGDLPPRPECAPKWMPQIIKYLEQIELRIVIGSYAHKYFLEEKRKVTEVVKDWKKYYPKFFVLPHPSPRNNIWLKRNPWVEEDLIPELKKNVKSLI
ncbi:MAG: uracil-DNA glycosylase family protein [Oligoflexia bacterium]|nr:uracil-DNA glycosylase family protein [Oligoflexia bacterium]